MSNLMSLDTLKSQARALRQALAATGHTVSHSQSLELLARQMGHRDWNTLYANVGNTPSSPYALGQRVRGAYLGQPFTGEIIGLREIADGSRYHLTLRFDEPVDVIRFEGMSNLRRQITATVNHEGITAEKTSNGKPHLVLDLTSRK